MSSTGAGRSELPYGTVKSSCNAAKIASAQIRIKNLEQEIFRLQNYIETLKIK